MNSEPQSGEQTDRKSGQASDTIDLGTVSRLIPLAREGNVEARGEICRQVLEHLGTLADRNLDVQLRGKLNPSDIVQQTVTRMISSFGDFRGANSSEFYGWLNAILKNEIRTTRRDLLRQRRDIRRERSLASGKTSDRSNDNEARTFDAADNRLTPTAEALWQERLERFHQALARLPEDYATVIALRSLDELPFIEVALRMDRSVDAVTKLFSRALVKLHEELNGLDESIS